MVLPQGFVDHHPDRGSRHTVGVPPEPLSRSIEVLLPPGETRRAAWSGTVWVGQEDMRPIAWRLVETSGPETDVLANEDLPKPPTWEFIF